MGTNQENKHYYKHTLGEEEVHAPQIQYQVRREAEAERRFLSRRAEDTW